MNETVTKFIALASDGKYEKAVDLLPAMTPNEIAESIVKITGPAQINAGRVGLRDAALIVAQGKIAERVGTSADRLARVGNGVMIVAAILAGVQAAAALGFLHR